ncbi:MAG: prepilin-type N-terminal cleavage/methylation domain-containing protein [Candidatus Omnitrophica bacterium]|nr:prepilin-type N-terminal cleavage/methylation domain-containing protein [Candidatus Omnitrophota bacterium]
MRLGIKHKTFNKNNEQAFTLLELIIALALLAIFASAAVSRFVDLANKSLDIQENASMASVRAAVLAYYGKYGALPQTAPFCSGTAISHWGFGGTIYCQGTMEEMLLENPPDWKENSYGDGLHRWGMCNVNWAVGSCPADPHSGWWIFCPHATDTSVTACNIWLLYFGGPCAGRIIKNPGGPYGSCQGHM